ncbi:MAG: S-layer family protein [Xenococcaceae cyanobacterium MO_167.B27]|nr:S-layer family protein [Xenococcaceae cyanobacterium MO_167.B27]
MEGGNNSSQSFPGGIFSEGNFSGEGNAGNITIDTTNLDITNGAIIGSLTSGTGNAGNITVNTTNLDITNGGQIRSSTSNSGNLGIGNVGKIQIKAEDTVTLDGEGMNELRTGIFSTVDFFDPFQIASESTAVGNSNIINISTNFLFITNNAQISAQTTSEATAGTLEINANKLVEVSGLESGLFSRTGGTGDAGNINITTPELRILDQAQIGVNNFIEISFQIETLRDEDGEPILDRSGNPLTIIRPVFNPREGSGNAGTLEITTSSLQLEDGGRIVAESVGGNGGNIELLVDELIFLGSGSSISTSAGLEGTGGNGGNIDINTSFLVAIPDQNSDITANAFNGSGGRININAVGIFGIEAREAETLNNDIIAISQTNPNLNGQINLNTLEIDPSRETFILPNQPLNTQIAQICTPGTAEAKSEFTFTGRGGIAPNTLEALQINPIAPDWVELPEAPNNSSETSASSFSVPNPTPQIVEATGWIRDENGEVILVADVNNVTGYDPWQKPRQCANN